MLEEKQDYFLEFLKKELDSRNLKTNIVKVDKPCIQIGIKGTYKLNSKSRKLPALHYEFLFDEKTESSLNELEACQELITKSLSYGDFSDGWRVMSEAGSYIMLQKGLGYIIANSKDVEKQAEKSVELESDNARALLIVAQGLINAPAIFGGNKKKGMAMMETLNLRRDIIDEDQYFIQMALSDVYKSNKRVADAIQIYNQLLNQYPFNEYIMKKLKELI